MSWVSACCWFAPLTVNDDVLPTVGTTPELKSLVSQCALLLPLPGPDDNCKNFCCSIGSKWTHCTHQGKCEKPDISSPLFNGWMEVQTNIISAMTAAMMQHTKAHTNKQTNEEQMNKQQKKNKQTNDKQTKNKQTNKQTNNN